MKSKANNLNFLNNIIHFIFSNNLKYTLLVRNSQLVSLYPAVPGYQIIIKKWIVLDFTKHSYMVDCLLFYLFYKDNFNFNSKGNQTPQERQILWKWEIISYIFIPWSLLLSKQIFHKQAICSTYSKGKQLYFKRKHISLSHTNSTYSEAPRHVQIIFLAFIYKGTHPGRLVRIPCSDTGDKTPWLSSAYHAIMPSPFLPARQSVLLRISVLPPLRAASLSVTKIYGVCLRMF